MYLYRNNTDHNNLCELFYLCPKLEQKKILTVKMPD